MSIHVYKPGDTHVVDGLKCAIVVCEIDSYADHLANGCVNDVRDLYPDLFSKIDLSLEEKSEEQIDLVSALESPDFLTKNIPMDNSDKGKKK